MSDVVLVTVEGAVRTVTLNRPEKRNALNGEMLDGLYEAFAREPAPEERVAVIRANGPSFCSGLDLRERRKGRGSQCRQRPVLPSAMGVPDGRECRHRRIRLARSARLE